MKYCSHCGKEIDENAEYCIHCGHAVTSSTKDDIPATSLNIISLFIPIVGLVLYLIYHDKAPRRATAIGKFSLIGVALSLLLILCMNYESPEERANRKMRESYNRVQEAHSRVEETQRQIDIIEGLLGKS